MGVLATNVVFIQISTDVSSALKIFETINERGIGLKPMDLLKNLLFTQVGQKEFTKLKDEWKKITGPLEKNKEKPLRFLRYFLMANFRIKNKRSDSVVREDEIYEWFVDKDNAVLANYQISRSTLSEKSSEVSSNTCRLPMAEETTAVPTLRWKIFALFAARHLVCTMSYCWRLAAFRSRFSTISFGNSKASSSSIFLRRPQQRTRTQFLDVGRRVAEHR